MSGGMWKRGALLTGCSLLAAGTDAARAAGTRAGTMIVNTATATYDDPTGDPRTVPSNVVELRVDELLDVAVSGPAADRTANAGAPNQVTSFIVTNAGNGAEAVRLSVEAALGGDDFNPTNVRIYLDSDKDGLFDANVDQLYTVGANDPLLAPDGQQRVFVVADMPAGTDGARAQIRLTGQAATGTGAPGDSFAGRGEGGGDAVVGSTGADADDDAFYALSAAVVDFEKTATVKDPFNGSEAVPGAVITYSLKASVSGSGTLRNFRITDVIPTDTKYEAGSVTLNGAKLTDAAGDDAGTAGASGIAVQVGDVSAGASNTVTFQVIID